MNFYGAFFAWIVLAALMVTAVVLAVQMSVWVLAVAFILFVIAFSKFGCLTH
ncbi:MAG: hypothetical protein QOF48_3168 [Verrucomicrobiota bacterium]